MSLGEDSDFKGHWQLAISYWLLSIKNIRPTAKSQLPIAVCGLFKPFSNPNPHPNPIISQNPQNAGR
jgi:hypothetical protein